MRRWEYITIEWVWSSGDIRLNLLTQQEFHKGSYVEVVSLLNELGKDCWEVAGKVASADWVYWTLKRPLE